MIVPRRILWSGGFDSTYLVLDALRRGEKVEPYYLLTAPSWQKQRREREAIRRIITSLPSEMRRNLVKGPDSWSPSLDDLWGRYVRLDGEMRQLTPGWLSQQLAYLMAAAQEIGGVETALVQGDHSLTGPHRIFLNEHHALRTPLERFDKTELLALARMHGFANLLALTWSCEADNADAASGSCGQCESCRRRVLSQEAFA